jgi:PKD repeat protein
MSRRLAAIVLLAALLIALPAAAAQTTSLSVVRYGWDNRTVAESVTVDIAWMEAHLPVMGDGVTPYYFQGPTFAPANLWDPAEAINVDSATIKINETIRGTAIRDLVDLVGGVHPGDEVQVRAADGFRKRFGYSNVETPLARQGPPVIAWWNARDGYAWSSSMRLFFLADTSSNPYGRHIFGNEDMRQCMAQKYWHYLSSDGINYPSASGLSVATIAYIEVFPAPRALAMPGSDLAPTDTDGDGLYDDANGNGRADFADVVLYFDSMDWIGSNEPVSFFDYNKNGRIDFADVVWLFGTL